MIDRRHLELCERGTKANYLYKEGRFHEAQTAYVRLLKDIEKTDAVDSYLVAKATLGVLLTHIRLGQFQQAVGVWTSQMDDSLYGVGIYGIEHAQTSVHDLICYDFVCAYLHTLTGTDKVEATQAVNQYMSRICEYLTEQDDMANLRLAVSNWKQHLNEIHGGRPPLADLRSLLELERSHFGEPVRLQSIGFPHPSDWERPHGFEEMSRVLERGAEKPKLRRAK